MWSFNRSGALLFGVFHLCAFSLCLKGFAAPSSIVVVGAGVVSPIGQNTTQFWANLRTRTSGIAPVRLFKPAQDYPFQYSAEVPLANGHLEAYLGTCPHVVMRLASIDRQSLLAVKASEEAVLSAGLLQEDPEKKTWRLNLPADRVGVAIGSTLGGPLTERAAGSRLLMGQMFRAPSEVAFALGADGFATCPVAACASGLHATIVAAQTLRASDADVMLAGATDSQISEASFTSRSAVLSRTGTVRPFDKDADGIVLGEGAAVVALTRRDYAEQSGLKVRATIAGYAARIGGNDLTRLYAELVARTMRDAIEKAEIGPADIGAVFAHAPGTPVGDEAELKAIQHVFGLQRVPIVSLSSRLGHPLGPAGSMRLVAALNALETQFLPGNLNLNSPRPGSEVLHFVGKDGMELKEVRYILINSYGFGGHYSSMVLEREG
ncbi:MAG: beta-ketoacyl synthase N-terminal-like domain-containing protein [Bdellovibrionota bacterium]